MSRDYELGRVSDFGAVDRQSRTGLMFYIYSQWYVGLVMLVGLFRTAVSASSALLLLLTIILSTAVHTILE